MSEVLRLPVWMAPAAQEAIRQDRWRTQPNPIAYVRTATHRIAVRMGLNEDEYKGPVDRSRKCPCGLMSKTEASKSGHACVAGEVDAFRLKLPDLSNSKDVTGNRFDARDLMEDQGLKGIFPEEDFEESFEIVGKDGIQYLGADLLRRVNPELIRFYQPHDWAQKVDRETEYGHPLVSLSDFGVAKVDWWKVAERLGFDNKTGAVMEMRFEMGWSREEVVFFAK